MTIIYAATSDQHLIATILPKIAQNNVNMVRLSVTFDSFWDSLTAKSAVFTTSLSDKPYEVALSSDGNCLVPYEVLINPCKLYITVKGITASGTTKTSTRLTVKVLEGTPVVIVSDPSPSVYQQILTANAILNSRMSALEKEGTVDGAEIIGVRTDADGKTHASAHDAVVAQVMSVRDGTMKDNLIALNSMSPGWLQNTGEFSNSHQMSNYFRWEYTSDLIPVIPSLPYILSIIHELTVAGWCCLCTYDSGKNFISRMFVKEYSTLEYHKQFTFSDDVAYVRISYRSFGTAKIKFEQSTYSTKLPVETLSDNLLESHPLIFDGFIVEGGSIYPQTAEGYAGEGEPAMLEKYSRHIPVTAGEEYTVYQASDKFPWCAIGIYDSEGKGITRFSTNDAKYTFTIPEGAVTMMVCARTHYLTDIALFKKCDFLCAEQRSRDNYLNMNKITETPDCSFDDIVKAVNHRGYCTVAPENTLAAYRLSKEKGFAYVECDVSFTSDGYPVLLHDSTIDRTSNGTGSIAGMTLEDVRKLDFGSWKSADYAGEKIPTFEEFILLCKRLGLHPYIELKTGTEDQIKGLVDVVKRYGMKGNVTWISFNSACLVYVKSVDTSARLGFVVDSVTASTITTIKQSLRTGKNEVFVDCSASNANEAAVALCADADIPLEVWTVNTEAAILSMNNYISGVTSDNLIVGKVLSDAEMNI